MPPITIFHWFISASPIILLFIMLLIFRMALVKAAAISLIIALLTSIIFFKASMELIAYESIKGVWNSLSIIIVIFPAILMYEVSRSVNAFKVIQNKITQLIPDKLLQVIAIGWCFTAFLQGPSGFGVPIAVAAPLLIGIGVKPLWAVIIPLIAQSWGSTFGTLALAWHALVEQSSLAMQIYSPFYFETSFLAAIFIGILCMSSGFVICWFYGGFKAVLHGSIAVSILGLIQSIGQLILSQINPTLCAFIPATIAFVAVFFLAKLPYYSKNKNIPSKILSEVEPGTTSYTEINIFYAILPYLLLIIISLGILLSDSIYILFEKFQIGFSFPQTQTGYDYIIPSVENYSPLKLFLHSGFFIFIATIITLFIYRKKFYSENSSIDQNIINIIIKNTCRKSIPASLAVMFLIVFSKIMNGSGEILVLAQGVASVTGVFYPFFAPFIGGIGAFISGSNVSSNILFGYFQDSIATILNLNIASILAAQTSGGAAGALIDPAKVLLGTTTANIAGREGDVLRILLTYFIVIIFVMGILTFCFA